MNPYIPRRGHRDRKRVAKQRLNISLSPESVRAFDKASFDAGLSISAWLERVATRHILDNGGLSAGDARRLPWSSVAEA
ncbi:MAG: hypothetical protein LBR12_06615 [Opitutaceae bacterium]|jgi:hypothetical protein|nr:hypothetical protein [Opitutaceae bacterium]